MLQRGQVSVGQPYGLPGWKELQRLTNLNRAVFFQDSYRIVTRVGVGVADVVGNVVASFVEVGPGLFWRQVLASANAVKRAPGRGRTIGERSRSLRTPSPLVGG